MTRLVTTPWVIHKPMERSLEPPPVFASTLRERGLGSPQLLVGDGKLGIWAALAEVFPAVALNAAPTTGP